MSCQFATTKSSNIYLYYYNNVLTLVDYTIKTLVELDLSYNKIGDLEAIYLGNGLLENRVISLLLF